MEFVDIKKQHESYKDDIEGKISEVLLHGRFILGPEVAELEGKLASFVQVNHCVGVSSGTASLEVALRALEIGPGDEVITAPFTWISSAEVIALVGATPVFVDIDEYSFNIDVESLEKSITGNTRAIIGVSLFGQMAEYEKIMSLVENLDIAVIEDGAQSFGALRHGHRSCGVTTIGSTSFFPAKTLGCYGDGGALFTDDPELAGKMRAMRAHGAINKDMHTVLGTNARLDTLQAAILLAKFEHFERELSQRRYLARRYTESLSEYVKTPNEIEGNTHVFGCYTIKTSDRDGLIEWLHSHGIPSVVYYRKCLHLQPVFERLPYSEGSFPVAEKACKEVVSLPIHPFLSDREQDVVIDRVVEYVA